MEKNKVLIIRFSSFGDIVQCSNVVDLIARRFDTTAIDWVTRSEFHGLVSLNTQIDRVWGLNKNDGFWGLIKLGLQLRSEKYNYVYDAHNNLRSKVLSIILRTKLLDSPSWLTRPKDRFKRLMLFIFRVNKFPKPFKGIHSYQSPLHRWGIKVDSNSELVHWDFPIIENNETASYLIEAPDRIVLVPSAAWEMKRWPLNHWKNLIRLLPDKQFFILGGKEDTFCEDIKMIDPKRVINLAGKLSLIESCHLIKYSQLVISADTGLLHVADVLGKKAIALIGPTAFGFTSSPLIKTMEVDLACRPCTKDGRGTCSQDVYQRCMVDITPANAARTVKQITND